MAIIVKDFLKVQADTYNAQHNLHHKLNLMMLRKCAIRKINPLYTDRDNCSIVHLNEAVGLESLEELPVVLVGHGGQDVPVEGVEHEVTEEVGGELLEDELVHAALPAEEDAGEAAEAAGIGHVRGVRHGHGGFQGSLKFEALVSKGTAHDEAT